MNTRLLRKVAKHIAAEPKRFNLSWWISRASCKADTFTDYNARPSRFAKCGTAACIAGWACILADGKAPAYVSEIAARAGKLLGLQMGEQDRLFGIAWWPHRFRKLYENAKSPRTRVKIAVARIEHFIRTKGAE